MKLDEAIEELNELSKLITVQERLEGMQNTVQYDIKEEPHEANIQDLRHILLNKNMLSERICNSIEGIHKDIANILGDLYLYHTASDKYANIVDKLDDIASYDKVKKFLMEDNFRSDDIVVKNIIDTYIDRLLEDIGDGLLDSSTRYLNDKILYNLLTTIDSLHTADYSSKITNMVYRVNNSNVDMVDIRILIENVLQHHNSLTIEDVNRIVDIKKTCQVLEKLNM